MKKMGVGLPNTFEPVELCSMSETNKLNSRKNIHNARDDFFHHMCGNFLLKHDEFLYVWQQDATGYTSGRRVEANNFELNDGNRRNQLSVPAKFILRHIQFSFNLSLDTIGALWTSFYALIMRRLIPTKSFLSSTSIWNNVMSLWTIDNTIQTKSFMRKIMKKTKHGFQVYVYLSGDDSKHFKRNHHVLILSDLDEVSPSTEYLSVPFDPTFRLVTTSPNEVKSDNYKKNADYIIDMLGLEAAAFVNGGLNDNANDAQKEIGDTIVEIQKRADLSQDENIHKSIYVNGVRRRPIICGDPYHWGNLTVMHASKGMSGDTVNGEHEQIHH